MSVHEFVELPQSRLAGCAGPCMRIEAIIAGGIPTPIAMSGAVDGGIRDQTQPAETLATGTYESVSAR